MNSPFWTSAGRCGEVEAVADVLSAVNWCKDLVRGSVVAREDGRNDACWVDGSNRGGVDTGFTVYLQLEMSSTLLKVAEALLGADASDDRVVPRRFGRGIFDLATGPGEGASDMFVVPDDDDRIGERILENVLPTVDVHLEPHGAAGVNGDISNGRFEAQLHGDALWDVVVGSLASAERESVQINVR